MSGRRRSSSPVCYADEVQSAPARNKTPSIRIKRIYDAPARTDGFRVLVDRLWPRGIRKDAAKLDAWVREVAPSPKLRAWFGHDPQRWTEFRKRYRAELRKHTADLKALQARAAAGPLTLLYAARDPEHNHALVLQEVLRKS